MTEHLTVMRQVQERVLDKEIELEKLKAAPREWVGLTDDDFVKAWAESKGDVLLRLKPFAKAIEAKLKEKNYAS